MVKISLWILGLVVIGLLGAMLFVRTSTLEPTAWHIDPWTTSKGQKPNNYLVAPAGDQPPLRRDKEAGLVAQKVLDLALSEPRTVLLAGSAGELWFTVVQRSAIIGFPDVISLRVRADDTGASSVVLYSRSRFGYSDLGVNKARATRWLRALDTELANS